jgi:hypothetical protein
MQLRLNLLGLFLAGPLSCAPRSEFTQTSSAHVAQPKEFSNNVEILTSPPDRPFREVDIIAASETSPFHSGGNSSLIEEVRASGVRNGCDAVWIRGTTSRTAGGVLGGTTGTNGATVGSVAGSTYSLKGYEATCLMFSSSSAVSIPSAPPEHVVEAADRRTPGALPRDILGFPFGVSRDEIREHCEAEGNAWDQTNGVDSCKGDFKYLEFNGSPSFEFCGERLCRVHLVLKPPAGAGNVAAGRYLARAVQRDHGAPKTAQDDVGRKCGFVGSEYDCFARKRARLRYTWRFESGDRLAVAVAANEKALEIELAVDFRKARREHGEDVESSATPVESASQPPVPGAACVPGTSIACVGNGACRGFQVCAEDGSRFEVCQCD